MRLSEVHHLGKGMAEKKENTPAEMEKFREQARKGKGPFAGLSEDEIDELMLSYEKFRPDNN